MRQEVQRGLLCCLVMFLLLQGTASAAPCTRVVIVTIDSPYMSVDGIRREIDTNATVRPIVFPPWNRALVPLRAIAGALGGVVTWDASTRTARVELGERVIELQPGRSQAIVDGKTIPMDVENHEVSSKIVAGRFFVPVRFLVEQAGCIVTWNGKDRSITVESRIRFLTGPMRVTAARSGDVFSAHVVLANPTNAAVSVSVHLAKTGVPDTWRSDFCSGDSCFFDEAEFLVSPGSRVVLDVNCFPQGAGKGKLVLTAVPGSWDAESMTIEIDSP